VSRTGCVPTLWRAGKSRGPMKALSLGLAIALLGVAASLFPPTAGLETSSGLAWLFFLRGPRPPPPEVVVAAIDVESAQRLGVSYAPRKWPRILHADLVRSLSRAGASVIAFDVFFEEPRDAEPDALFAQALAEAGNVVLFEFLTESRGYDPASEAAASQVRVSVEQRIPPTEPFASAAAAVAPFPLPRVPYRVDRFWLFKAGAGDVPTLPFMAFHIHARPYVAEFQRLLGELSAAKLAPGSGGVLGQAPPDDERRPVDLAWALRDAVRTDPAFERVLRRRLVLPAGGGAAPDNAKVLLAMARAYGGSDVRYLDFYGPAGTVTTISYHKLLATPPAGTPLRGKAVFVGFSERFEVQKEDYFHTVFTQPNGVYLSGVEIAATAFGNLVEGRSILPLAPGTRLLLVAGFGLALGILLLVLPANLVVMAALGVTAAHLSAAWYAFAAHGLWLPVVVPLVIQAPVALAGALVLRYAQTREERRRLETEFLRLRGVFGNYLPPDVVEEIARETSRVAPESRVVDGVCLATDAERYTTLSETIAPVALLELLNKYYEVVFPPVRAHGGRVSDVVGDAMLAIWAGLPSTRNLRQDACAAALEIQAAVSEFNRRYPSTPLPTRLGLHWGVMALGSVGADGHLEYRAVGDIINSATRIQELNKRLKTRILVSKEVMAEAHGFEWRALGEFQLEGKKASLEVYELLRRAGEAPSSAERDAVFAAGLAAFRSARWREAAAAFEEGAMRFGDGPAAFYFDLCAAYRRHPPAEPWRGVVTFEANWDRSH